MSLLRWSAAGLIAAFELCSGSAMAANDPLCKGHKDCRPLTSKEIKFAKTLFGNQIDYPKVRIINQPSALLKYFGAGARVDESNIRYHDQGFLSKDHAKESIDNRVVIAHELTHVWQNQHGRDTRMMSLTLTLRFPMNYSSSYKYKFGQPFDEYNMEQQAAIVAGYMLRRELYNDLQKDFAQSSGKKRHTISAGLETLCDVIAEHYKILAPILPLSPHRCNRAPQ